MVKTTTKLLRWKFQILRVTTSTDRHWIWILVHNFDSLDKFTMRTLNPTLEEHFAVKCAENRVLLFGAFDLSTNVTKITRRNKWEEIAQELISMGAPIKSAAHLRDVSF